MNKQKANILAASMLTIALTACGGGGGGGTTDPVVEPTPTPGVTYTLSGSISGLTTSGLTLSLNNSETIEVAANATTLSFTAALADAASYEVSISTQPNGLICSATNASGSISAANVENIAITCATSYTVSGTIEGLSTETATLSLNGSESLTTTSSEAAFTFTTALVEGASYAVTVTDSPDTFTCNVEQGSGTIATANITNVLVKCLPPTAWNMLNFSGLEINKPRPIVEWGFKVIDRYTGEGVNELTLSDFQVLQDDEELSARESFLELEKIAATDNFSFSTVFMLDISSSLTSQNIDDMKEAVKNIIRDPQSGDSLLDSNQTVAIYTFDDNITPVVSATNNVDTLISKIDTIKGGNSSTNLYGAIKQGANTWVDRFAIEQVRTGAMIVVTDGRDTASITSKSEAIAAVENKSVFAIFVGDSSASAVTDLKDIVGTKRVYTPADFNAFSGILAEAKAEADKVDDGLYILYYATPSRAGNHEVTVKALDQFTCAEAVGDEVITLTYVDGCSDYFSLTFNADGLASIGPEFKLSGQDYLSSGELTVSAKTFWTNEPNDYTWQITNADGGLTWTKNQEDTVYTFKLGANQTGGLAVITVTDNNLGEQLVKTIKIGTGVFASSNSTVFEVSAETPSIQLTATSIGGDSPSYTWSVPDTSVASINNSALASGSSVTIYRTIGNSKNEVTTLTLTDTANNYTQDYTITNFSSVIGVTKVSATSDRICGFTSTDSICWSSGSTIITDNTKPELSNPVQMTIGYRHFCAIDDSGLQCWGQSDGYGNSAVPETLTNPTQISGRYRHTCAIGDLGVECWGSNSYGQTTVPVLTNPTDVFTGQFNSCAIDDNGVNCWGRTTYNLTMPPALTNPSSVSVGLNLNICSIDDNGISCWGYTGYNISSVPTMTDPQQVSVGYSHACAIDKKVGGNEVVCWGQDSSGNTNVPSGDDALVNPTSVTAGQNFTCAVDDNGTQCWGSSSYSVLP